MGKLEHLLENNKNWARQMTERQPDFFKHLSELQSPDYLWIGCSDSRITPAASIGLLPGELFVHRNIANLVVHSDMNCLSVMQYAVEALKVKHIIVCGHYGCGGVLAALENIRFGLIDNWLRHIQDIIKDYKDVLDEARDDDEKFEWLCELNVIEQVLNAGESTVLQDAWQRGQELAIHGWIYHLKDGIFQDLNVSISSLGDMEMLRVRLLERRKEKGMGR